MNKKVKDVFMYVLGGIIVIGFFAILAYLIYTKGYESTLNLAIGALIGAFTTIVGFFFGSSKGSHDKNELIKKG